MKRLTFVTLFSLLAILVEISAADYRVKGFATDSAGVAESFATLHIFQYPDTLKPVTNGVAGEDGAFDKQLPAAGDYRIVLTSVGRSPIARDFSVSPAAPVADLGNLMFGMGEMLGEVTVTATKPLVSREIDRIGYDVQGDPDAQTSQLDEMLKKVPMISVDPDGTIKINGSSSFKIYKNGRSNNAFTNNSKDIFKSLPASMIRRIEVITDPGAREDAEGSSVILNIVTMENVIIKGVMGTAGLGWTTNNNLPNPNFWLMSQIGKLTFDISAGYSSKPSRKGAEDHYTDRSFPDTGNESREHTHQYVGSQSTNLNFSMSLDIDSLNMLTGEFYGYFGSSHTRADFTYGMYDPVDSLIYGYSNDRVIDPSRYHWLGGNLNYQHLTRRPGEKYIFTYNISGNGSSSRSTETYHDQVNMPVDYTGIIQKSNATFVEHTLQADWTRPFNRVNTVDVGAKYVYRDNHSKSNRNYVGEAVALTDFSHLTQIAAIYADYRLNLGSFGFRAGARYEYSRLSAKFKDGSGDNYHSDLNDICPNAAFSYSINDRNSLRLGYSSSINRPGIYYLNPTVVSNPQSVSVGNPDLSSTRNHSLSLNYSFFSQKINLSFDANYSFSNNAIIQIQELLENDILFSTYENAGKNYSFNASLYFSIQAGSKTNIGLNAWAGYAHTSNPSLNLKLGAWNPGAYLNLSQRLPWKINMSLWLNYYNGYKSLYQKFEPVGFASKLDHGINFTRNFLKENRLSVRLYVTNLFGNGRRTFRSHMLNVPYDSRSYSVTSNARVIGVSLSMRFGKLNARVKKVRSVSNNDLIGGPSR
ncbi:MAG: outer membrane beta-barrel family protein [Clostridium sp.]|nr:outer membrane beta-barrel family protein [Clostridium sp.]